jgi:uncharacterized protein with FMN-binding domain
MVMGSAAVVAVYSAGFFHTAAAAAKVAAEERGRSDSRGRGNQVEPAAPAASPALANVPTQAPSLPVKAPATPPPAAVPATLQTPTPAPSAAATAATPPSAPAPTPVAPVAPVAAVLPAQAPAVPAALPNPVPAAPVQVATVAASPAPAAPASVATAAAPAVAKKYKDGAYFGWGRCRHGDLKVTLELKDDKIVSAEITECYTRYSKNVISRLPKQLVDRQNPDKIDRISGASESSDAYYYAVLEAMKAAKL